MNSFRFVRRCALSLILVSASSITSSQADTSWKVYGFLKPEYNFSTHGAASFGRENMEAVTAAYLGQDALDRESRTHFSVAQSRIGVTFEPRSRLTGQIEFDFIDFSKATPTVASVPRLRLAKVEVALNDHTTLLMGQDWDLFSPVKPFTFNYVGLYFQAGNAGFIRQQLTLRHRAGSWEVAGSVAGNGVNTGANDNAVEITRMPVLEARITHWLNERSRVGLSALQNSRSYTNASSQIRRRNLTGYNAFGEFHVGSALDLNAEAYLGRNLADSGSALTLSQGSFATSTREMGAYLSFQTHLTERLTAFGGAGQARVFNASDLTAYTPAASNSGSVFSIARNRTAKLGLSLKPDPNFTVYVEGARFLTRYAGTGTSPQAGTNTIEAGMLLPF